jgi:hypothetical protein
LLLLGDSKVIIDWINDKVELRSAALECWKERTTEAKRLLKSFTAIHIYREENNTADQLSKQALTRPPSLITFPRWEDGIEGPSIQLKL